MTKTLKPIALSLLALTPALAAQTTDRILRFDTAAQVTGNLRSGPVNYAGKGGAPIKATVGNVNISAPKAVLSAPAGSTLAGAEGKRSATFSGDVQVTRGRLTARGGQLNYSEASGQGVLSQSPSATFTPEKKDGDPVNIKAALMSLDIDRDQSTSTGNVQLLSGQQSGKADRLVFDEDRELAQLTGNLSLSRAASARSKELIITGDEARVLTKTKQMYVKGNVKLVQGSTTTTGDAMYYDDVKNVAYVVGHAVSVDSKGGNTVKAPASGSLEQRTDLGRVRALNTAYHIPAEQFRLSGEK